jgi:hypothetical protein
LGSIDSLSPGFLSTCYPQLAAVLASMVLETREEVMQ